MEVKVDALVLRCADYGENDRMLTLFTLQRGKIAACCKGVRKPKAKLRFAAQPFCFAEYVLAEKNGRYTVTGAAGMDSFYPLREDIAKLYAAGCVTGLCDALLYENMISGELFLRAVNALREMCDGDEGTALIGFFLHAVELSGYGLAPPVCADCGAELEGGAFFDLSDGCFTCRDCRRGAGVRPETVAVLKYCLGDTGCAVTAEGKKRLLKLLRVYLRDKAGIEIRALAEYIDLL